MTGKELELRGPHTSIRGAYADIILDDPDALADFLASCHHYYVLHDARGDELQAPLTATTIDYLLDDGEPQLHGVFEFVVDPTVTYDSYGWQGNLAIRLRQTLHERDIATDQLPTQKDDFFFELDEHYSIHIKFGANLQNCDVELHLLNNAELYKALNQDKPKNPKAFAKEAEPPYNTVFKFAQAWLMIQDQIIEEFNAANIDSVQRRQYRLSVASQLSPSETDERIFIDHQGGHDRTPALDPFDLVGGAYQAKAALSEIVTMLEHPEVAKRYNTDAPNILLYGPAGAGKTTLAHAFAEKIGAEIIELDSTSVMGKWLGDSGKNVGKHIAEARDKAKRGRVVVLFEEFSTLAHADNDRHSDRRDALKKLNIELDKIEENPNVIVVAAMNDSIHELDESLARRFEHIHMPKPNDRERAEVWLCCLIEAGYEILVDELNPDQDTATHSALFDSTINPFELAAASEDMSGAECRIVVKKAARQAASRHIATGQPQQISQAHLLEAIRQFGR